MSRLTDSAKNAWWFDNSWRAPYAHSGIMKSVFGITTTASARRDQCRNEHFLMPIRDTYKMMLRHTNSEAKIQNF